MRNVFLLGFVLLTATSAAAAPGDWTPHPSTIAKLEKAIRIPAGRGRLPLAGYARFYTGVTVGGRRKVQGELVEPFFADGHAGIHVVDESRFSMIKDDGCGLVVVTYDVATARVETALCGGFF